MFLAKRLTTALAAIMLLLLCSSLAVAATPPTLTREAATFSDWVPYPPPPPGGLPLVCSLGTNYVKFNFSGSATGPYAGTFTEKGAVTYTLAPGQGIEYVGTVTGFWASFTIRSHAGWVTGSQHLDKNATPTPASHCFLALGGTSFGPDPLPADYMAVIATGRGLRRDHGASTVTLSSGRGGVADYAGSSIAASFVSATH